MGSSLLVLFLGTTLAVFATASIGTSQNNLLDDDCQSHSSKLCNSFSSNCGLNSSESRARFLTPNKDLFTVLREITRRSKVPISFGPLIKNNGTGLINIDVPLDHKLSKIIKTDVCGATNPKPTIRDAVICTVTHDERVKPPRGNDDPTRIGKSTQGRILLGVRLGNPRGRRVFIVTQQHGNEAASTEAALAILRALTRNKTRFSKAVLSKLDLLFLIRANPDGGEANANNNPTFGVPYTESTGFFRHNIDRSAGGGFENPTEPGFFGVVGRGYDINRYNYANLKTAIRPVESQATVAVLHAFRPDFVFDAHGDMQKVLCHLNPDSLVPGGAGGLLPSVQCLPPALPVPTLHTQPESMVVGGFLANDASLLRGNNTDDLESGANFTYSKLLVRSIVAEVMKRVNPSIVGELTRYSQIQIPGAADLGKQIPGTLDIATITLSGIGIGWEVLNSGTAMRPAVVQLKDVDGILKPAVGFDSAFIEPCFLRDNICLHKNFMRHTLLATIKFLDKDLVGDNGYCNIPLNTGQVIRLPESLGFPPDIATEEDVMFPGSGYFGVPSFITGTCPGDPPNRTK